MSYWNYRIVHRHYPKHNEDVYGIHEVYYDDNGVIEGISMEPCPVYAESMDGHKQVFEMMGKAFTKDVLEWDDIPEKKMEMNSPTDNHETFLSNIDGE